MENRFLRVQRLRLVSRVLAIGWLLTVTAIYCCATDHAISTRAIADVSPDTDPKSAFWKNTVPIAIESKDSGEKSSNLRAQVRSRWTKGNLYFLFICQYLDLHLKPMPETRRETQVLWNWDVAETFIGSDFDEIKRYKEFEVSPRGEWTDLDIDLNKPHHEDGWVWNSGFEVAARIDHTAKCWYGFMRIPYSAIDSRPAHTGNKLRINFFLSEGKGSNHISLAWRPTHQTTFHVPQVFGILELAR